MKVYRHVEGNSYLYYVQDENATVLWFPEMAWRCRNVEQPEGKLVAEGPEEKVMFEIRELLPSDLLVEIRNALKVETAFGLTDLDLMVSEDKAYTR